MEPTNQEIDNIFAALDKTNTPGCNLAVIKDGEIVYQHSYGMANLEHSVPIKRETRFQIGSISKHFTAMSIALLENDGKISIEDDIRKYLPEVPDFGNPITINHLLHHTSGLREWTAMALLSGSRMDDIVVLQDGLDMIPRQKELNFKPGEQYLYCNTGYAFLSIIVERASGKPLHQFAEERLFKPLGMKDTLFHSSYRQVIPNFAASYTPDGNGGFGWIPLVQAIPGSTSLITTVDDLLKWDQEFYEGKVVGMDVIERMHTQGVLNSGEVITYAFGLEVKPYRGLKTVSHGGSHAGFRAGLLRYPDQRLTVVVMANRADVLGESLAQNVADLYLADTYTEKPTEAALEEKPVEVSVEKLQACAGLYYSKKERATHRLFYRDGTLFFAFGPGVPLIPLSETRFHLAPYPFIKVEVKGEPGKRQMNMLMLDELEVYEEIESWKPAPKILEEFAGSYYSSELDYAHSINFSDGKLSMFMRKLGSAQLTPSFKDAFSMDISHLIGGPFKLDLVFERNQAGKVSSFRLHAGRIQNVLFEKR
jgi:CubicO group peptidase (beta-lactamase class C family)